MASNNNVTLVEAFIQHVRDGGTWYIGLVTDSARPGPTLILNTIVQWMDQDQRRAVSAKVLIAAPVNESDEVRIQIAKLGLVLLGMVDYEIEMFDKISSRYNLNLVSSLEQMIIGASSNLNNTLTSVGMWASELVYSPQDDSTHFQMVFDDSPTYSPLESMDITSTDIPGETDFLPSFPLIPLPFERSFTA